MLAEFIRVKFLAWYLADNFSTQSLFQSPRMLLWVEGKYIGQ